MLNSFAEALMWNWSLFFFCRTPCLAEGFQEHTCFQKTRFGTVHTAHQQHESAQRPPAVTQMHARYLPRCWLTRCETTETLRLARRPKRTTPLPRRGPSTPWAPQRSPLRQSPSDSRAGTVQFLATRFVPRSAVPGGRLAVSPRWRNQQAPCGSNADAMGSVAAGPTPPSLSRPSCKW